MYTLATWCEEQTHWKRPWCWAQLKAGGEGDDRGWDSWMASPKWWIWVWASSGSWSWTEKPGVLQSMGLQRVGHDWVTELNWTDYMYVHACVYYHSNVYIYIYIYIHTHTYIIKRFILWTYGGIHTHTHKDILPCIRYWRRKWQPTPEFLPRESYEQRSLVGFHGIARVRHNLTTKPPPSYNRNVLSVLVVLFSGEYPLINW